jgi:hypothetical protein
MDEFDGLWTPSDGIISLTYEEQVLIDILILK